MESKKQIYDLIPWQYYPETIFVRADTAIEQITSEINIRILSYPLVAKPDIGMKGLSVKKVYNETELEEYLNQSKVDFLVQQFIDYENEIGIFYYRLPNEEQGHISGIVKKEFLAVVGDGKSTIVNLLKRDKRFILQLPSLMKSYGDELNVILQKGEKKILVPYGNHVRGAKFIDISYRVDEELTATIDAICRRVKGFYFGRLDVRFKSWEDLKRGKNISIIELNGAGSEPTHMYDPRHSIFFAWREIIRHWNILWSISRINHRQHQLPYMRTSSGLKMFKQNNAYVKMISEDFKQRA